MSQLYRDRVYAIDRAKASALTKEYAKIRSRKGKKNSRKAVMNLLYPARSTRTALSQQVVEASGEPQQEFFQLNVGTAACPDDIPLTFFDTCRQRVPQFYWSYLTAVGYAAGARNPCTRRTCSPSVKNGSDPADVGCCYTMALTLTIGKVWKILIAISLSFWLEEHSTPSP